MGLLVESRWSYNHSHSSNSEIGFFGIFIWTFDIWMLFWELGFLSRVCSEFFDVGWSNNFVSKRKSHLRIPVYDGWNKPLDDGFFIFKPISCMG